MSKALNSLVSRCFIFEIKNSDYEKLETHLIENFVRLLIVATAVLSHKNFN